MTAEAEKAKEIAAALEADIARTVAASLTDPDLVDRSQDFKDGYAKGFREASLAFVVAKFRNP